MSRIHEALQQAERERHLRGGAAPPSSVETGAPDVPEADALVLAPPSPEESPLLTYEHLLARIPHAEWKVDGKRLVVWGAHEARGVLEQFRTLRARLYQLRGTMKLQTLVLASAVPGEGKTFMAANLAATFARQRGRRVLLIDADVRRPSLQAILGAPQEPGLADYLKGDCDEYAIMQQGPVEGLIFIPGGRVPSHPSELIASQRLKTLIDRLAPCFDWVLIDTPAAVPMADASIVANHADGVLLVVKAAGTPRELAAKARDEFRRPVVGVVLNSVAQNEGYGYYYYSSTYDNEPKHSNSGR